MNSKLLFLTLALVIVIVGGVGSVSAVGKADVLTDIKSFINLYYTTKCNNVSNIAYGDWYRCRSSSTDVFAANYNNAPILLTSFLGNLSNNQTMINDSIQGLMTMTVEQNDLGDFPVSNLDQLQSPNGDTIQVHGAILAFSDAYSRIESNLSQSQKDSLERMFVKWVNWALTDYTTISNYSSFVSGDRINTASYRKQLNLSVSPSIYNVSDNAFIEVRISTDITNLSIPPNNSVFTVYFNNNVNINYTYLSQRYNNNTLFIDIPVNITDLKNTCGNGLCNLTIAKNTVWPNGEGYGVVRGSANGLNDTWSSTDGVTWTNQPTKNYWIGLVYFDNSTLTKLDFATPVSNQKSIRALACYRVWLILNSTNNYPFSKNIAERCYNQLNQVMANSSEGIYPEWNEQIRTATGTNGSFLEFTGYSPHYNFVTVLNLANYYKLTNNQTFLDNLNTTFENMSYFIYNDNLTVAGGFGTRIGNESGTRLKSISSNWINYDILASLSIINGKSNNLNLLANRFINYTSANPVSFYLGTTPYTLPTPIIYLYENFPIQYNNSNLITSQGRFIKNFNINKLFSISTNNYLSYISYGNATSSGGVIDLIYNKQKDSYLFSGVTGSAKNNSYGLGILASGNINTGSYNSFDIRSNNILISSIYPYKLQFYGNLTQVNTSKISNITYNTTYTFYDKYIKVDQTTNSPVELQVWSINSSNIITSRIVSGDMTIKDNITFFPLFDLSYTNTSDETAWGIVNKFNASGTQFVYYLQLNGDYDFAENGSFLLNNPYSTYKNATFKNKTNLLSFNSNNGSIFGSTAINNNDGNINITLPAGNSSYILDNFNLTEGVSRENSPLWFSQSTNTNKHIANNLTDTITSDIIIDVDSCDNVGNIIYTSHSGAYTQTFQKGSYTCNNNQAYLTVSGIEPSLTSNELTIEYGCNTFTTTGYFIVMIFGSLIIVMSLGYFAYKSFQDGSMSLGSLITMFMIIIISLAMWLASGQNLGASCGVVG